MFYKQDEQLNCDCGSQDFTQYNEEMEEDEDGIIYKCDICEEVNDINDVLEYEDYLLEVEKDDTDYFNLINRHEN
jgi:hypothetical protein